VVPTTFRYNAEHDAIDVGGLRMSQTKKLRDVQRTGRASIVIDDVLPPWQPRMIEVRGTAAVVPSGGKAFVSGPRTPSSASGRRGSSPSASTLARRPAHGQSARPSYRQSGRHANHEQLHT
jgi:hypothetical protein